ncbi:response regulator [Pseudanabaena sp. UWO310]|uniref:response regulator n=1 Tax=Pseudanabaena sp. UWO310 TaxID=2480795 RepID=UPI0011577BAB|nr:response regulator [Pseudanabaena sp. UWO310]TYQ30497.1 response regulator [Pseudanabaena sp. UWO310]
MLGSDRLEPKYLCFPQIPHQTSGEASIVIKAIEQVFQLLPDLENHLPLEPYPLTSIDLQKLLDFLKGDRQEPICVAGTFSKSEAISYSYQELGLNLFDLPWFSPPERKVFRHFNLLDLSNHTDVLRACFSTTKPTILEKYNFTDAAKHLQWAKCHQFAKAIQNAVGHGNRDEMQDPNSDRTTSTSMQSRIKEVQNSHSGLPCADRCQLYAKIEEIKGIKLNATDNDEKKRLVLAQQVAALDCQTYRLAQALYTPAIEDNLVESSKLESPRFKKIIILDDNENFKKVLEEEFKKVGNTDLVDSKFVVETLNVKFCWEHFGLFKKGEKEPYDLLKQLKKEGVSPAEILTCFDLDLGSPSETLPKIVNNCFGGHWILYGTAREHPDVPRLVITGFRSQELLSYTAGGSAYLLKPFTTESLQEKIKEASILHRVTWLCPRNIQTDYSSLLPTTSDDKTFQFEHIQRQLHNWLENRRIELKIIEDIDSNKERICESDVIIIDLDQSSVNQSEPQNNLTCLIEKISQVVHLNPHASVLVILPIAEGINDSFAGYYRKLPLNLQDGSDMILRKPMWITDNLHPDLSLGGAIVHQLKRLNDYDTKYQVLIPIASLLKNKSDKYLNLVDCMKAHGEASQKISEEIIKPLTQVFGGVTCHELGIRGSWYDATAKKIDDTVIMIEFCAKSSLMAKQFIEKTVIRYLRQVAGEDVVLLQEIPIRGRLL